MIRVADRLSSGVVRIAPGAATPLPPSRSCIAVTIWNRTGYDLGIGGPEVATSSMLPDGGSYRVPVRAAELVHLFLSPTAPGPAEVAYTVEE